MFQFFLSFFLFYLILLWKLTEFSHLLLELFVSWFNCLFFFCICYLFLFEFIFLLLECFMDLVHFTTFLQKFCSRRYGVVLIECWDFYLFLCCHRSTINNDYLCLCKLTIMWNKLYLPKYTRKQIQYKIVDIMLC